MTQENFKLWLTLATDIEVELIIDLLNKITDRCSLIWEENIDLFVLNRWDFEKVKRMMFNDPKFCNAFELLLVYIRAYRNDYIDEELADKAFSDYLEGSI